MIEVNAYLKIYSFKYDDFLCEMSPGIPRAPRVTYFLYFEPAGASSDIDSGRMDIYIHALEHIIEKFDEGVETSPQLRGRAAISFFHAVFIMLMNRGKYLIRVDLFIHSV